MASFVNNTSSERSVPTLPSIPELNNQQAISLAFLAIFSIYSLKIVKNSLFSVKAPYVGHRSFFEPAWLVGLRFVRGSEPMINEGYQKAASSTCYIAKTSLILTVLQYKDDMFKVRRNDADILVVSNKYVDELRNMPDRQISATKAHVANLLGRYSTTRILLESDLHTRVLQTKLTPNLAVVMPAMKDELDFALNTEVPNCKGEWVTVQINEILLRIVARISARVFLGADACRNEEWLAASIHYTENIFLTVMLLRRFPSPIHPFIAPLLPSFWAIRSNLSTARRIVGPMVRERVAAAKQEDGGYQKHNDLLQWMMDAANEHDGQPHKLAHRQLLLSLASIHTTTMAATHALYDLCAHPEYFDPLREEILGVLRADGGWEKTSLNKLRNLDSFMKESQRLNPPSLLAFNRIVQTRITLSDGTVLPKGTHLSMPSAAILHNRALQQASTASSSKEDQDPSNTFDPLRYARLRAASADNANRFRFAQTDRDNLHFGHGKYACPGRFFAAAEIKMILAHLLVRYEFRYPDDGYGDKHGRPRNLSADENLYPDPSARLLLREREGLEEDIKRLVGI